MATIVMFAGNFAPRTWALCQGQLLAISSNSALFSLLGVTYGGDGRTTFGLPDLRGRVPVGTGSGPGFTNRLLGARSGVEYNNLTVAHLPAHTHTAVGKSVTGGDNELTGTSAGNLLAADGSVQVTLGSTGGNQAVNNMQPFLALNFIICMQGTYPSRS